MLVWSKCSEQTDSPEKTTGRTKPSPKKRLKQLQWECSSCSPNIKLKTPHLHSGVACDRLDTTKTPKLPTVTEVVLQEHPETLTDQYTLDNTTNDSTIQHTQGTSETTVASQTSPPKGTQSQNYVGATEHPPGNQTGNEPVPFLNCSKNRPTDIQISEQQETTKITTDTTIPPLTTTTPLIEERLERDEPKNEVSLPLTSTVFLKQKQARRFVPLDFENNQTVEAMVDSGAYVSPVTQNDLDTIKEKAPTKILKNDDPPDFQIQVANGQLEKPLETTTLKFENGDHYFAEHIVVLKKLTGPIIGWHFVRNNSVVIDTTHGLILFPHLTMQVKTASSETITKPQPVITEDALTIPPTTTKTITAFVDYPSKSNTIGTVTSLEKFTETATLLTSHSMSTIIDNRIAGRITNTTESICLIKKQTYIAEFPVVTPEQSKHIKPVDMAILSMIPHGDPDLTAYLDELHRTNKPEQQNNTIWFLTPENPTKPEDNTPIQTRFSRKLIEFKDKGKLNPQESTEHQNKFLKQFDWTDKFLTGTEK